MRFTGVKRVQGVFLHRRGRRKKDSTGVKKGKGVFLYLNVGCDPCIAPCPKTNRHIINPTNALIRTMPLVKFGCYTIVNHGRIRGSALYKYTKPTNINHTNILIRTMPFVRFNSDAIRFTKKRAVMQPTSHNSPFLYLIR